MYLITNNKSSEIKSQLVNSNNQIGVNKARPVFNWVDNADLRNFLNVTDRTLQTYRDKGILPYSKIRGRIYYKISDIESLLEAGYVQSKTAENGNK